MCTARLTRADALSDECQILCRAAKDSPKQMDRVIAVAPERYGSTIGHLQNDGLTAELTFQLRQSAIQLYAGHLMAALM